MTTYTPRPAFGSDEETAELLAMIEADDARIRAENPTWDADCAAEERAYGRAMRRSAR